MAGVLLIMTSAWLGGCSDAHESEVASSQPELGALPVPPLAGAPAPAPDPLRHCREGYAVDARDVGLPGTPLRYDLGSGRVDMLVPEAVQQWMQEQHWPRMYDSWHAVRRFDYYCGQSNTFEEGSPCPYAREQEQAGLLRAQVQHCAPGDGLAFLMMHRELLELVRLAFPMHAQLFAGFEHVPRSQTDPENPNPEIAVAWTPAQVEAFERLEQIEAHADEFADEDALGAYIQCEVRWTPYDPSTPLQDATAGVLQRGLYNQWSVLGSPAALGSTRVKVLNHAFWKIHGFIDQVWERYRRVRGLSTRDAGYSSAQLAQCDELHNLATHARSRPEPTSDGAHGGSSGASMETGVFAETIRPMFEARCGTCHGAEGPAGGLILGGTSVLSADVYRGLVGVPAANGNYALIEAGDAARSWLYLKASGQSAQAACERPCERGVMPPSGPGLTAEQLGKLAQWINAGAQP